jgi:lipoprotein-anchoring transpeptidase ErfK/SrfK
MINKNKNNWIIVLLSLIIGILILSAIFVFSLKNQAFSDLKVLTQNQAVTSALNNKYVTDYKKVENDYSKSINNSFNPLELRQTITKIFDTNTNAVGDYKKEIENVKLEFGQSLEAWKKGITTDANFDAKAKILPELDKLSLDVAKITNSDQLEVQKNTFANLQTTYAVQLDTYNKKALINGIKSAQNEVNDLIDYLKKYPDLLDQMNAVQKYKTDIDTLSQDNELAKYKYQDLENKVNAELRPKLAAGFKAKADNEEQLRLKAIATQSRTDGTFSTAPVANGKAILIKKSEQKMYIYQDGQLLRTSPVTTGRTNWPTDVGTFSVLTKERDRRLQGSGQGATWNVFVSYWMLFNGEQEEGIHDASWRNGFFGGQDYLTTGSRGCVNTPDDTMIWLFDWANIGTPVIVQE